MEVDRAWLLLRPFFEGAFMSDRTMFIVGLTLGLLWVGAITLMAWTVLQ